MVTKKESSILHIQLVLNKKIINEFRRKIQELRYHSMAEFFREKVRKVLNDD